MEARIFDVAAEYLCPAIESAQAQGWKLVSAAAHDTSAAVYHCVFVATAEARNLDLILSAYAPIGKHA